VRKKGYQMNTRALLKRNPRERGKTTLSKVLQSYNEGDKVLVKIDSSMHKGMPHRRFHGRIGVIRAKRGRSYVIHVTQGDATKEIIVRPEHLTPYSSTMVN
jgi:large subunit ribosomal protein L21e